MPDGKYMVTITVTKTYDTPEEKEEIDRVFEQLRKIAKKAKCLVFTEEMNTE